MLHQIGEEHHIAGHDQEASNSHGPSIKPLVSSTLVRMQPIQGRRRWRVDWRGRGRDGGQGHGQGCEGGRGTPEPTLPPLSPTPIFSQDISILPILTHHSILRFAPILTHHPILLYLHRLTYPLPYPHKLTHQSRHPLHMSSHHYHPHLPLYRPYLYHLRCYQSL